MSSAGRASRAGAANRAAPTPSTQQPPLVAAQPPLSGLGASAPSSIDELFLNPLLWKAAGLRGPIKMQALRHDPSLQPFKFEARVGWFPGEAQSVTLPPPQPTTGKDRHGHAEPSGSTNSSRYTGYGGLYEGAGYVGRDATVRHHHADHSAGVRERQATQQYDLSAAATTLTPVTLAPPPPPINHSRTQPHHFAGSGPANGAQSAQGPLDSLQDVQQGCTVASRDTSFPGYLRHLRRRSRSSPRLKCSSTKLRARAHWLLQDRIVVAAASSSAGPGTSTEKQQAVLSDGAGVQATTTATTQLLAPAALAQPATSALLDIASILQQALVCAPPPPPQLTAPSEPATAIAQPLNSSNSNMEAETQATADMQTPLVATGAINASSPGACLPTQPSISLCEMVQAQCTPRPSDSGCSRGSLHLKTQPSVQAPSCPPTSSDTSSQHGFAAPGLSASGSVDSQLDLLHPGKRTGRAKLQAAHSPNSPLSLHDDVDMTLAQ